MESNKKNVGYNKKTKKPTRDVPFTPITSDADILDFIHSLNGDPKHDDIVGRARGLSNFQINVIRQVFGKTAYQMKYHTDETIEKAIELYKQGLMVKDIACKCGITVSGVYGILERKGIERARKDEWSVFRCGRLVKLREVNKLTWKEIAKFMGNLSISCVAAKYKEIKLKEAQNQD